MLSSDSFLVINEVDIAFIKSQELEYRDILIAKDMDNTSDTIIHVIIYNTLRTHYICWRPTRKVSYSYTQS